MAAIYLVPVSPPGSCGPPENQTRRVTSLLLLGLAFEWGLPCDPALAGPGSLLHYLFTLTPLKAGRYIFCGAIRSPFLSKRVPSCYEASLPLKARTFLPSPPATGESGRQACFDFFLHLLLSRRCILSKIPRLPKNRLAEPPSLLPELRKIPFLYIRESPP